MEHPILSKNEYIKFREGVREFIETNVKPFALGWESQRKFPNHLLPLMAEKGFIGLSLPQNFSGHGKDIWYEVVLAEELAKSHCLGWALSIIAHTNMVMPLLDELGSDEQKKKILNPAIKGSFYISLGITEADSGSDINAVKTEVIIDQENVVINGSKKYITNGSIAKYALVLAKIPSKKDIWSLGFVILENSLSGYSTKRLETSGFRSGDTAELHFNDCKTSRNMLLGEPGKGFYYLLKCIQRERLIGAIALNELSLHVISETIYFLKTRERFGSSLSKKQSIRHNIAELRTKVEASKQLAYNSIEAYKKNEPIDSEVIMIKIFAYETAKEVIDYCLHLHGAEGFLEDHWLSYTAKDAQAFTLVAGTSEVMRDILASLLRM